ncbi:histidine phosphatase family protein (plasmid) [Azospirillum sp. A26]|uniref:histidine phosphatase family protein n=1 Tax=Azospirillum sp. A26 TaxID=3160607 RepID=UPI00366EE99B
MTVRLLLITHAATSAVRTASFPLDEPLDTMGLADTQAAAATPLRVDRCWSGPEQRTRQTATALGLDAAVNPELADWDCGRWAGATLADLHAREAEAVGAWLSSPDAAPHGGESLNDLLSRIGRWLDQLTPAPRVARSTRIVAVTHPTVARAAVVQALCGTAASFWRIDIGPLSRIELVGQPGRWGLRTISRAGRWEEEASDGS